MPKDYDSDISSDGADVPFSSGRDESAHVEKQLNGKFEDRAEEPSEEAENAEGEQEAKDEDEDEDDDADDGEGGDNPDEFIVEEILSHEWIAGELQYETKWKDYDSSENTYEPLDNLLPGAKVALAAYHKKIGGEPQPPKSSKKRKSLPSLKAEVNDSDTPSNKKSKRNNSSSKETGYYPSGKNWDAEIASIETVERDENTGKLNAFIKFNNGKRTKVGMEKVYKHCPMPMLKFYENHLKFT